MPIYYNELMEVYNPQPVAVKVTSKTFLVRFPSCYGDINMEWIDGSINAFYESGCENLILDIRGNSGGSDIYWNPYWSLLADHDGEICDVEYRNSAAYRDSLLQELRSQNLPAEIIQGVQSVFPMLQPSSLFLAQLYANSWAISLETSLFPSLTCRVYLNRSLTLN